MGAKRLTWVALAGLLLATRGAWASRVAVIPVVIGGAGQAPPSDLLAALVRGVKGPRPWEVKAGTELQAWLVEPPAVLTDEDRAQLMQRLGEAEQALAAGNAASGIALLEPLQMELEAMPRRGGRGPAGDDLALRVHATLVTALLASGQTEKAAASAAAGVLLYPKRPLAEEWPLSPEARALWQKGAPPDLGLQLKLDSEPQGCELRLDGVSVGRSPLTVMVAAGGTYRAQAVCGEAPTTVSSTVHIVGTSASEATRQVMLDTTFERHLVAEGMQLRFSTSEERRTEEADFARKIANTLNADSVVLVSVGELNGTDWLNGRLFLRSGYPNRQGLVRLEPGRANLLGHYLATGQEANGVLKAADAALLVSTSRSPITADLPQASWYHNPVAWGLVGVGVATLSVGIWAVVSAHTKSNRANADGLTAGERQDLLTSASYRQIGGNLAFALGGTVLCAGTVLLALPQENEMAGAVRVSLLPGGGSVAMSGHF